MLVTFVSASYCQSLIYSHLIAILKKVVAVAARGDFPAHAIVFKCAMFSKNKLSQMHLHEFTIRITLFNIPPDFRATSVGNRYHQYAREKLK